ncbi:hypothetical protein J6590_026402 [Homalodisca vitripennis]|nr:hypothetical protein J6590_026402 [Homalodisca vitripennis]
MLLGTIRAGMFLRPARAVICLISTDNDTRSADKTDQSKGHTMGGGCRIKRAQSNRREVTTCAVDGAQLWPATAHFGPGPLHSLTRALYSVHWRNTLYSQSSASDS